MMRRQNPYPNDPWEPRPWPRRDIPLVLIALLLVTWIVLEASPEAAEFIRKLLTHIRI
jgi:hypothetical protein